MPVVRFSRDTQLVGVRREVCPRAKWDKAARAWSMTAAEAEAFIAADHARLDFARYCMEIAIDADRRIVGFAQDAPKRLEAVTGPTLRLPPEREPRGAVPPLGSANGSGPQPLPSIAPRQAAGHLARTFGPGAHNVFRFIMIKMGGVGRPRPDQLRPAPLHQR